MISHRLVAYNPRDDTYTVLVDAKNIRLSTPMNATPTLQFSMPNSTHLHGFQDWSVRLGGVADIIFEVEHDQRWIEPPNCRFVIMSDESNGGVAGVTKYECQGVHFDLSGSVDTWQTNRDKESHGLKFNDVTPGAVMTRYMQSGQALGFMSKLTQDFGANGTTNGTQWEKRDLDLELSVEATPADALDAIAEWVDWRFVKNVFQMYNANELGTDQPCELVFGREFEELTEANDYQQTATSIFGVGSKNWTLQPTPANTRMRSTRGPRAAVVRFPDIDKHAPLMAAAKKRGQAQSAQLEEYSRDLLDSALFVPYRDYWVGDTVMLQRADGSFMRQRVTNLVFSQDEEGFGGWTIFFGDEVLTAGRKLATRVKAAGGTAATKGSNRPLVSVNAPSGPPRPPTGLTLSTAQMSAVGGFTVASVKAVWVPPTQTDKGFDLTGTLQYRVRSRLVAAAGESAADWESWGSTDAVTAEREGMRAGRRYLVQVAAANGNGWGAWCDEVEIVSAADVTPPDPPTAPILQSSMGTVSAAWDGLLSSGPPPDDFSHIEVSAKGALAGSLRNEGDRVTVSGVRGEMLTVSFRAVDTAGNRSEARSLSIAVRGVLDDDVVSDLFDRSNALGQKFDSTGKIMSQFVPVLGTEHLLAGSIDVDRLDAGTFAGKIIEGAKIVSPHPTNGSRVTIENSTLTVTRSTEDEDRVSLTFGGSEDDVLILQDQSGEVLHGMYPNGNMFSRGEASFGDVFVAGERVTDLIDARGRGVLSSFRSTGTWHKAGNAPIGVVLLRCDVEAGRSYRINFQGAFLPDQSGDVLELSCRYAVGAYATVSSPSAGSMQAPLTNSASSTESLEVLFTSGATGYATFLVTARNVSTSARGITPWGSSERPVQAYVQDIGVPTSGASSWYLGGGVPFSTASSIPTDPVSRQVKTYNATWTRSWRDGAITNDGLQHGVYGGIRRYSMFGFASSLASDLAGASVKKAEVYMLNKRWWGNSGNAYIGAASNTSAPANPVTSGSTVRSSGWPSGGGRWVDVTSVFNASSRSITLGVGANDGNGSYGAFDGAFGNLKLRLTIEK